jgi:hypothetical protein
METEVFKPTVYTCPGSALQRPRFPVIEQLRINAVRSIVPDAATVAGTVPVWESRWASARLATPLR